jgi:hypothetical protein
MSRSPSAFVRKISSGLPPEEGTRIPQTRDTIFFFISVAGGRGLVPMVLHVQFGGFGGVMGGMVQVSLRGVRVVSRCVVVAFFMMPGRLAMVVRRQLMVLCCLVMVLRCLF